jgi:hypothetical protein
MEATNELALFAELGAAFAGFIAIFLIFARREGRVSPADSLRIESIILASFSAVFYSLIPLVLARAGLTGGSLWRVASAVALASGFVQGGVVARKQIALSSEERAAVGAGHSLITWGLFALAAVFFSMNAFRPAAAAWPYLASLVCILAIAAMNFVTIAFQRLL